jgi:hypothetical protein
VKSITESGRQYTETESAGMVTNSVSLTGCEAALSKEFFRGELNPEAFTLVAKRILNNPTTQMPANECACTLRNIVIV